MTTMHDFNNARPTHECGGTLLHGNGVSSADTYTYCSHCAAFRFDVNDQPFPTGTDRDANIAAWDAGELSSTNDERDRIGTPPADHHLFGGDACTDGGFGACEGCGVVLEPCEMCDGLGYHRDGCQEIDAPDGAGEVLSGSVVHHRGYTIMRGGYYGTTDDRADRWYVEHGEGGGPSDHRGPGHVSLAAAREAIDERIER